MSMQFSASRLHTKGSELRARQQAVYFILVALKAQFGLFQIGENDDRKQMPLE